MRSHRLSAVVAALGLGVALSPSHAQIQPGPFTVRLETVASGLVAPTQLVPVPDGTGRLFVIDQIGRIHVLKNGALVTPPFLDVTAELPTLNAGFDERGLLGLAFHPRYPENGRFFIRYSRPRAGAAGEPCFGTARGCHEEILAEYRVSDNDPNLANAGSGVILFRVNKPQFNHNGGGVAFGPDGYLYFSLGDGGGAHDGLADNPPSHGPGGNGQNLSAVLGKMLRIDVSTPGAYTIPPDNPFVSTVGARPEIFAYGLRNPYAFSFDNLPGGDGRLIVADVGQGVWEEINFVTAGGNYGWVIREGAHCFDPFNPTVPPATCNATGLIDPVAEYPHTDNGVINGISIIGGFVYRGRALPGLNGRYLFGDFSTAFGAANGKLFSCDLSQPAPAPITRLKLGADDAPLARFVKGFGRDAAGEVYVAVSNLGGPSGATGEIRRIVPCPADFNGSAVIGVQDLFDYLTAYFANDPRGDFNGIGGNSVQDVLAFLAAYLGGC